VGETKTEASSKPIPLDDSLLQELTLWRAESPYPRDTDYVFASAKMKGKQPLWLDTLMRKVIKPAALKAGNPPQGLAHLTPHLFYAAEQKWE
jgi:hypothetical protein